MKMASAIRAAITAPPARPASPTSIQLGELFPRRLDSNGDGLGGADAVISVGEERVIAALRLDGIAWEPDGNGVFPIEAAVFEASYDNRPPG